MNLPNRQTMKGNAMTTSTMLVYKTRRYPGILWHAGNMAFNNVDAALLYRKHISPTIEIRACVNGLRWNIEPSSFTHEHTATLYR